MGTGYPIPCSNLNNKKICLKATYISSSYLIPSIKFSEIREFNIDTIINQSFVYYSYKKNYPHIIEFRKNSASLRFAVIGGLLYWLDKSSGYTARFGDDEVSHVSRFENDKMAYYRESLKELVIVTKIDSKYIHP